ATWRWPRNHSNASGKSVKTSILNELDEHAPALARRRRPGDRADRVRDAAPAADEAPDLAAPDRHLEHHLAVLVALLDAHRVGVIHEGAAEELDQLAHRLGAGGGDALSAQERRHRARRLRPPLEPVAHPLLVELDHRGLGLGVVMADRLDRPPVARRAPVGDDDAPDWVLLGPDPRQADAD